MAKDTPGEDIAFMREVEDDVRREKQLAFLKKYGALIVSAVVVAALVLGGWRLWQQRQLQEQQRWNNAFIAAQTLASEGKTAKAREAFKALASEAGKTGYGMLAGFAVAALEENNGAASVAGKHYAELAPSPLLMAKLADVAAASRIPPAQWSDTLLSSLQLMAQGDSTAPFRFSARSMLALKAAEDGNLKDAAKRWEALRSDPATPALLQQRAEKMLLALPSPEPTADTATDKE